MTEPSAEEIAAFVAQHGCFCGGSGRYTDYNCGAPFEVTCPHCRGSGTKKCDCSRPEIACGGRR